MRRRIGLLLSRGLGWMSDSSTPLQTLQIELLKGEVLDGIEHLEPYGFTARPLAGYHPLAASLGGNRDHTVVLVTTDRRYRKKDLATGEVALYTDEGDYILLKRGRIVEVVAGAKMKVTAPDVEVIASTKVMLTTPLVECSTDLKVNGTATVIGAIIGQGGLAVSGGGGATVAGNMAISGGNVTADGISLKTHVHGGVQAGSGLTAAPQ